MNPIVRNVLAVLAGLFLGGLVNMAIIKLSPFIIPPPPGADVTTEEGLKASIHLFQPIHFLMPFLAHAIGTLVGGFFAALLAASRKMLLALIVGAFNLSGGIMAVLMFPAPMWFNVADLVLAYFPMAWLGATLATFKKSL
ncbi:MAG: hypothetical protein U0T73_11660 [Chitinophagales bacterium]